MPTSKQLRAPPTQDFDKYVFTRTIGQGVELFPIASSIMKKFSNSASDGASDESYSPTTPIGFNFKFNEKTYDRFVAHTNGFIILRELSDTSPIDLQDYLNEEFDNIAILDRFTTKGVLLCPWFDDLKNAFTDVSQLGLPTLVDEQRVQAGFVVPPPSLNQSTSALKYANTISPAGGKCLVVRWRSLNNFSDEPSCVITFEAVIYESGKIEFRYDIRDDITSSGSNADIEGATIGIFLNDRLNSDSTYWRFRDFSIGLGHPKDHLRKISRYGGCDYDQGYYDAFGAVDKPYNITLFTSEVKNSTTDPEFLGRPSNWPAQGSFKCMMTFAPPVNRRKVLPRKDVTQNDSRLTYPLVARTGDVQRLGTFLSMFDDRRVLVYGRPRIASYPTTLPREYASTEEGAPDRQNLYGDFDVTASVARATADSLIGNVPAKYSTPFSDHDRPEQSPSTFNDPYYMTGSSIELFGDDLLYPLRSKTQIKLELPLHHKLQMPEVDSAIFYYNNKAKGLFVPQGGNTSSDIMRATDCAPYQTEGLYWPEDARGFGPISNVVASGSNPGPMTLGWSSDPEFGLGSGFWSQNTASMGVLTKKYEKNTQLNPDYLATQDELVSIPINQPFILEKAVFELPFIFGQGWFEDRTTSSTPLGVCAPSGRDIGIAANVFDFAGPAITVSLFNQISNGLVTHRDLILTGTVIPEGDNTGNVAVRQSWVKNSDGNTYPIWLFEPEGFAKYGGVPSAVVTPDVDNCYTGSVKIPTTAVVSNGFVLCEGIRASSFSSPFASAAPRSEFLKSIMMTPEISISAPLTITSLKGFASSAKIKSVNPFSRNSRGDSVSGRSVYGKEHTTFQAAKDGLVNNPLYVSSNYEDFPVALKSVLDVNINNEFQSWFQYSIPIDKSTPSPYLLLPGDKLIFAISKNRPTIHTNGHLPIADVPIDHWRHGLRHDVWVNSGSIKVTLYGSLPRAGKEFHDPSNQTLGSNFVHESIGSEPVCDQFQVEYDEFFYGSYTDSYITGSLFPETRTSTTYTVGSTSVQKSTTDIQFGPVRGKLFSKMYAEGNDLNNVDYTLNNSKSLRLQPRREKVGTQRFLRVSNTSERFFDSLMPNFAECLAINGKYIHHIGDPSQIFQSNVGAYQRDKSYGVIFLNSFVDNDSNFELMNDAAWTQSFPFEGKYSGVSRNQTFNKHFITNLSASISPIETKIIKDKRIDHLLICQRNDDDYINIMCDVDLSRKVIAQPPLVPISVEQYVTSSMSQYDMLRVLYGFGDGRINHSIAGENGAASYQQQPLFRNTHAVNESENFNTVNFQFSPVIRGWKYGVFSGLPAYSSIVFNRNKYGQLRDMLEQRLDSKFFYEDISPEGKNSGVKNSTSSSPVTVRFVNSYTGEITKPENTWSNNLHFESASIVPYFDGVYTNRDDDFFGINQTLVELRL